MVPDVRRKLKFYAQKDLINFKELKIGRDRIFQMANQLLTKNINYNDKKYLCLDLINFKETINFVELI